MIENFACMFYTEAFCSVQIGTCPQSTILMLRSVLIKTLWFREVMSQLLLRSMYSLHFFRCVMLMQSVIKDSSDVNSNNSHHFFMQFLVAWVHWSYRGFSNILAIEVFSYDCGRITKILNLFHNSMELDISDTNLRLHAHSKRLAYWPIS